MRVGVPAKRRHGPDFVGSAGPPVIDLRPVGRKTVHGLVAIVARKLQGFAPRCEHHEYLSDVPNQRAERYGVSVGRKAADQIIGLSQWLI